MAIAPASFLVRTADCTPIYLAAVQSVDASEGFVDVDEATARSLVKGCNIPREIKGVGTPGDQTILQFTVSEKGKLLGVHRVQGVLNHQLSETFASCHFKPYKVNDVPKAFRANITMNEK
jgi:hypothetical protein